MNDYEKQRRDVERQALIDLAKTERDTADAIMQAQRDLEAKIAEEEHRFASQNRSRRFAWKYHKSIAELRQMRTMQARAAYERRKASR